MGEWLLKVKVKSWDRVFGSQASGATGKTSDLDLLVDLEPERDLLDLVAFKLALEDHLGCRVDVLLEVIGEIVWRVVQKRLPTLKRHVGVMLSGKPARQPSSR